MKSIYVTKPFLPDFEIYQKYIKEIFNSAVLTNQGGLVKELEEKLSEYLNTPFFHYVTNGTIALQLAINALDIIEGEIITTPFSYVATTNAILWQNCVPIFVDIEPDNFTIDPEKIENAITEKTKAILAVHVFGYACQIEKIEAIASKYNIPVIYDAAHAFGSMYKNKQLVTYGDISTCSFHATKLFHTVEGGACITSNVNLSNKIELKKRFGHHNDEYFFMGINGKQSEFHAAMGLANFPNLPKIIEKRKNIFKQYDESLNTIIQRPKMQEDLIYNYAYYPVLFKNEQELLKVFEKLNEKNIYPRRYFYPSLNTLPFLQKKTSCKISEDVCLRIACLPVYYDLTTEEIDNIVTIIKNTIR